MLTERNEAQQCNNRQNKEKRYQRIYFTLIEERATSKIKCWAFMNVNYKAIKYIDMQKRNWQNYNHSEL